MVGSRSSVLEQVDRLARVEGDDGPLGVRTVPERVALAVDLGLSLAVEGVDLVDADVERLLDGPAHIDLGGRRVDHEDVDVLVHQGVGLLRHHWSDQHVVGIPHDPLPSTSVSSAGVASSLWSVLSSSATSSATSSTSLPSAALPSAVPPDPASSESSGSSVTRTGPGWLWPGRVWSVKTIQSLTRMS